MSWPDLLRIWAAAELVPGDAGANLRHQTEALLHQDVTLQIQAWHRGAVLTPEALRWLRQAPAVATEVACAVWALPGATYARQYITDLASPADWREGARRALATGILTPSGFFRGLEVQQASPTSALYAGLGTPADFAALAHDSVPGDRLEALLRAEPRGRVAHWHDVWGHQVQTRTLRMPIEGWGPCDAAAQAALLRAWAPRGAGELALNGLAREPTASVAARAWYAWCLQLAAG